MRQLTSAPALLALVALAACASGGSRELRETEVVRSPTLITDGDGNTMQLETQRELVAHGGSVALPIEQAYRRLHVVYDQLDIEPRAFSSRDHFVGNQNVVLRRRLGSRRLSALLDCGAGMTGPHADNYEITMSIVTQLQPEGDASTRVSTRIVASARPMGVAGTPVSCRSTGRLEREIVQLVGGQG